MSGRASFSGAVLVGGRSLRMGTDKTRMLVRGRPLAAHAARALAEAGAAEVSAVGGDRAQARALGAVHVPDRYPGAGPLGGIITALAASHHVPVVVLAGDLPFIEARHVEALLDGLTAGATASAVRDGSGSQPLLAAFGLGALAALERSWQDGDRSARRALSRLAVRWVDVDDPFAAVDLDEPDDLRRYAALLAPTTRRAIT